MKIIHQNNNQVFATQSYSVNLKKEAATFKFDYKGNHTPQTKAIFTFTESKTGKSVVQTLVGHPVDIASSAYQYRADRKPNANQPESWFALMHYAGMPLNKAFDVNAPAIKRVLNGLIWEEIRPVKTFELVWKNDAKHLPSPENITITTIERPNNSNLGWDPSNASTWWHNIVAIEKNIKPTISKDGKTYSYTLNADVTGIVVSLKNKNALDYNVPNRTRNNIIQLETNGN